MSCHVQPVALVTGAARRIGAVLVKALHQTGFRVVVHYHRSATQAHQLVTELNQIRPHTGLALSANLCSPTAPALLVEALIAQWGRLDVLINNASIFSRQDTDWDAMWQCNVQAPYHLSRKALAYLAVAQGSIINITDIHAYVPLRDYAAYCQTKAALAMQTRVFAQEFAPQVRVNDIAPGAILWPEGANELDTPIQKKIIHKALLQRHGTPENIAQAMLYLIQNTYVTGQCLRVDGGRYTTI